jgi:P63C domain-containing protein
MTSADDNPPQGRAKGGLARAERLSPERRSEIASKAALSRWQRTENSLVATYGSPDKPLKIGTAEIGCYVLSDNTRVLARVGFLRAIGRTGKAKGGRDYDDELQTPVFLTAENLKPFISADLLENAKPIIFNAQGAQMIGYRAELLPQVCEVFLDANEAGALKPNQRHIAAQCKILHRAFARIGIIGLVDEATGFQQVRDREALQAFLDRFLRKELAAWVKTFPDEFFEQLFRLKRWQWSGTTRRPQVVGKYINDLIYDRLGPGVLEELRRRNPSNEKGRRKAKHFQWLTEDIGHPALAQHMYATIGFMRAAADWHAFKESFSRAFPKRGENLSLALSFNPNPIDPPAVNRELTT